MGATEIDFICAFDVFAAAVARPVQDAWPAAAPVDGAKYRWLHFDLATRGLDEWMAENLPEIPARTLMQSETRPRADAYGDGLILNLRGVNMNPGADPDDMVSVRLWVTPDLIVSTRARKVWAADALRQGMADGQAPETATFFIGELASALTRRIEKVSHEMDEATDELEERVLGDNEIDNGKIATIRQSVIKLRRFVAPQRQALDFLASDENPMHDEARAAHFRETANRATRTVEELEATRDRLTALQEHILGRRDQMQARNGYILSIVAAIFLPLGFLTGLFGVNVAGMPGTTDPAAFFVLSLASLVIGLLLYAIFRFSKWL